MTDAEYENSHLFEDPRTEPRRWYARNLDSEVIGKKVRVRTGKTLIIEDVVTQVVHFSGTTRLYFQDTKSYPALFSGDNGYQIAQDEIVEVIL